MGRQATVLTGRNTRRGGPRYRSTAEQRSQRKKDPVQQGQRSSPSSHQGDGPSESERRANEGVRLGVQPLRRGLRERPAGQSFTVTPTTWRAGGITGKPLALSH